MRNLRAKRFISGVLGLIVSLVLLAGVGILWLPQANAASTVTIGIDPPIRNVEFNETFTLDIKVTMTASENVSGAEAHIDFDATKLEVESITKGVAIGAWLEILPSWDNTAGTIDYAVGAMPSPVMNQTFVLATIEFKALAVTNSTALSFVTTPGVRETIVSYEGWSVLDGVVNGEVRISLPAVRLEVTGSAAMPAGGSNELTITAKDQNGGVAYGYSGVKNLTFSGPGVVPGGQPPTVEGTVTGSVTAINFTEGISNAGAATLRAYKAETTTVNVSDSSINSSGGYGLHLTVNPLAVSKLAFITTAQTITAGQPSAVMTVQSQDAYGNPVKVSSDITLNLSSPTAMGLFSLNATSWVNINSVTIASGQNSASFYYKDTLAGTPTITAAESPSQGWTAASQAETVNAGAINRIVFVTGAQTLTAGQVTGVMTLQTQDAYGNPTGVTGATTINLTSNSATGKFYSDAAGSNLTTSVILSSGASSASFYYKDTKAGSLSITAAESPDKGWTDASQPENVSPAAASSLVVSGITAPIDTSIASDVTVTVVDSYGNTVTGYTGTIHFTSSDGKATLPADYTFVAADNGSHSFVGGVILETGGEQQSVTATDTVTSSITGQQTGITVTGGGSTPWVAIIGGILGGLLVIGIIVYLLWIRKRT